jgi:Bacterial Ig-like domain/FecR protein
MFPTNSGASDSDDAALPGAGAPLLAPLASDLGLNVTADRHEAPDLALDCAVRDRITIADPALLFCGNYERTGPDLIIVRESHRLHIRGYFASDHPPSLVSPSGAGISSKTVELLAGPEHPGQYVQADTTPGAHAIGKVETATGLVTVTRANGVVVQTMVGDLVYQGDVVETGSDSACGVVFLDGTAFSLSSSARLALNQFVYDPRGSSNSAVFAIVEGAISFVVAKVAKTGHMLVETPAVTLGIRGTTVQVVADSRLGSVNAVLGTDPGGGNGAFDVLENDPSAIDAWLGGDLSRVRGHVSSPGSGVSVVGTAIQNVSGPPPNFAALFQAYALGQQDPFIQQQQDQQPDDTPQRNNHGRGSSTPPNELLPPFVFNFSHPEAQVSSSPVTLSSDHPVPAAFTLTQEFFVPPGQIVESARPTLPVITIISPIALRIAGSDIVNAEQASTGFKISGTTSGVEDGQVVKVKIINSSSVVVENFQTTVMHGGWFVTVSPADAKALADGTYMVAADVSNRAGEPAPEVIQTLRVDQTPPSVDISNPGGVTDEPTHIITGRVDVADAGTIVTVFDGAKPIAQALVQPNGSFSATVNLSDNGTHVLTAQDTDAAGNTGTSNAVILTVETTPLALTCDRIVLEQDTGPSGSDFITREGHVTLTGRVSEPLDQALVQVFDNGKPLGIGIVSNNGTWTLSADLGEGAHTFSATAKDGAGNSARAENSQIVVVDQDVGQQTNLSIKFVNTIITDTGAVHFTVDGLEGDDSALAAFTDVNGRSTIVQVSKNGEATVDVTDLADGPIQALLSVSDLAGNSFSISATNAVVLDPDRKNDLTTILTGLSHGNAIQDTGVRVSSVLDEGIDVASNAAYQWQESRDQGTTWIQVGTGASFTPTEAVELNQLRVIVSFHKGNGDTESIALSAGSVGEAVGEDEWQASSWEAASHWSNGVPAFAANAVAESAGVFTVTSNDSAGSSVVNDAGGLVSDGALSLSGALILAAGTLQLGGDRLQATLLDIHGQGVFEGFGTVHLDVTNNGTIETLANESLPLYVTGNINGTGTIVIANQSTFELGGSAAPNEIVKFAASSGALALDHVESFAGAVWGFGNDAVGEDLIALKQVDFTSKQFTDSSVNGILTVSDGTSTAHIPLLGNYSPANFKFAPDGFGGTQVTDPKVSAQQIKTALPITQTSVPLATGMTAAEDNGTSEAGKVPDVRFYDGHNGSQSIYQVQHENAYRADQQTGDPRSGPGLPDARPGEAGHWMCVELGGSDHDSFVFYGPAFDGSSSLHSASRPMELDLALASSLGALHELLAIYEDRTEILEACWCGHDANAVTLHVKGTYHADLAVGLAG